MDPAHTHPTNEARRYAAAPRDDDRALTCCGGWSCGCDYFRAHAFCAHTMAVERLLGDTLTAA